MLKIVTDETAPISGELAEQLEALDVLRAALLSGEVSEVVWVALCPDDSVRTFVTRTDNAFVRIAAVSRLLHRLHTLADETAREL